jgi:hypothetical protein
MEEFVRLIVEKIESSLNHWIELYPSPHKDRQRFTSDEELKERLDVEFGGVKSFFEQYRRDSERTKSHYNDMDKFKASYWAGAEVLYNPLDCDSLKLRDCSVIYDSKWETDSKKLSFCKTENMAYATLKLVWEKYGLSNPDFNVDNWISGRFYGNGIFLENRSPDKRWYKITWFKEYGYFSVETGNAEFVFNKRGRIIHKSRVTRKITCYYEKGYTRYRYGGKIRVLSLKNWADLFNFNFLSESLIRDLYVLNRKALDYTKVLPIRNMSLSNKAIRESTSLRKAIKRELGVTYGTSMAKLPDGARVNLLSSLKTQKNIDRCETLLKGFIGEGRVFVNEEDSNYVLMNLFEYKFNNQIAHNLFDEMQSNLILDYIFLASQCNEMVNMGINSPLRINREHDRLSSLLTVERTPKLKTIPKKLKLLVDADNETVEYELIETRERLVVEGTLMKHCVASRAFDINKGVCAIYSVRNRDGGDDTSNRWTADIRAEGNCGFKIHEIRGYRNASPPKHIVDAVTKDLATRTPQTPTLQTPTLQTQALSGYSIEEFNMPF